jgi:sulfate permease, SulP family
MARSGRGSILSQYLPILGWARRYRREDFTNDLLAGVITTIMLVPQGMAFGLLAGLSPQAGLYSSILPPLLYALLGTSRTLAVGPVSVAAIMVAQALASVPSGAGYAADALALALLVGAILIALGVARLGVLANFLSHPVLSGFTSAAAVIIILSQLPSLIGIHLPKHVSILQAPAAVLHGLQGLNPVTLGLGLLSVALLLYAGAPLERLLRRSGMASGRAGVIGKAAPLAVVALTTLLVVAFALDEGRAVDVVGMLPGGLPGLGLDLPAFTTIVSLLPSAALIAIVGYVESVSIAKMLANRRRESIDPNQELLALGAANLSAAFSGGMPVAGGFSRTLVNFAAGARTQAAGIITAVLVAVVALYFTPLLAHVPKAALAAIIIVAVSRLIDVHAAVAAWKYDRIDGSVLLGTAAGVLILGIEAGLTTGVALSLLLYMWRVSRPHLAVLGRLAGSEHFRNVTRYRDLETWEHLLLVRVDEQLSFANSAYLEETLMRRSVENRKLRHLVLVCSGINGVDFSAVEMLVRLAQGLRQADVLLHLAEVKGPVMDRLRRSNLLKVMEPGRVFLSAHEAVEALAQPASAELRAGQR